MKKIVTVAGARPQFVKVAAVSRALQGTGIQEVLIHTGQHFDRNMSDLFFEEMEIRKPDYNLNIHSLSHGAMTGRMLEEIEKVLLVEKPDMVMVYGDTNSTLAGALAAAKLHIPVAHVEAGLRSFNMKMPEEINRILTDRISSLLFCPTQTAVDNLHREGFENYNCSIIKNGDVMQDAALFYGQRSAAKSDIVRRLGLEHKDFILCTIHRQENTDNPECLNAIFSALNQMQKEVQIVFPMHPRTRGILNEKNISTAFTPIDPVGYFDMIELLRHCRLVMTDSGGLQKEAFFFGKHCVTARDETEWTELVDHGFNILAGADYDKLRYGVEMMMQKESNFEIDLYGNGKASQVVANELLKRF
ncbi:MAG: UDP-N-acetylglucosamine 2-epimerase (non-hydrolyzing) [Bacteroidota bacterium]|nr:UDP-N-acetylglucosamine 2-epimerase (non-hydrolyzing) [Bacteroidota bacterium]MDP4205453.1 UDP-N-acetylglucosamine 2-epimerase (non-hydrolyzing) [Bacteroidota bacterium]